MLHEVCIDTNGGGVWRFNDADASYFRTEADGTVNGRIYGRFLPDPEDLWQKRADALDVARASEVGDKLKPQPATFALWKHWQGVHYANHDA